MLTSKWKNLEVVSFDGIITETGDAYEIHNGVLVRVDSNPKPISYLNVAILAQKTLGTGKYLLSCGEALEHGSIGVIVLESLPTRKVIWSFVSAESNPFDQIEEKTAYTLVLSTSGTAFRFQPELEAVLLVKH